MFDYPLPIPRSTTYETFGLGPEAAMDEVREATLELVTRLKAERQAAERAIEAVRNAVPGLHEATELAKKVRAEGQADADAEVVRAERRLAELTQQAMAVNPRYRELCDQSRELEERILQVNRLALQNPEERQNYDRSNPPLELLKLEDGARNELADNRLVLPLLRQEVSRWLSEQGEEVFHPSDLTRDDFGADFSPQRLLDGP